MRSLAGQRHNKATDLSKQEGHENQQTYQYAGPYANHFPFFSASALYGGLVGMHKKSCVVR